MHFCLFTKAAPKVLFLRTPSKQTTANTFMSHSAFSLILYQKKKKESHLLLTFIPGLCSLLLSHFLLPFCFLPPTHTAATSQFASPCIFPRKKSLFPHSLVSHQFCHAVASKCFQLLLPFIQKVISTIPPLIMSQIVYVSNMTMTNNFQHKNNK